MCGLCGYITKQGAKLSPDKLEARKRIMTALLVGMQERGDDSAGIAAIGEHTTICKKAMTAYELIQTPQYIKAISKHNDIVIGHTRLATTGAVTDDNAHPFRKGTIIGAHNGMVSNHLTIDATAQVDSEVIFTELNKEKNDYRKVFPRLSGQFAITWTSAMDQNCLYLVRKDNPLVVVTVKSLSTVFYCSLPLPLIGSILAATGQTIQAWEPKENTVYRIDGRLNITKDKVSFKKTEPKYGIWDWYKYDKAYDKEDKNGDYMDAEDYEGEDLPLGYDQQDAIAWSLDNDVCELCSKAINNQPCYYNVSEYFPVCMACARNGGLINSRDYEYMTAEKAKKRN